MADKQSVRYYSSFGGNAAVVSLEKGNFSITNDLNNSTFNTAAVDPIPVKDIVQFFKTTYNQGRPLQVKYECANAAVATLKAKTSYKIKISQVDNVPTTNGDVFREGSLSQIREYVVITGESAPLLQPFLDLFVDKINSDPYSIMTAERPLVGAGIFGNHLRLTQKDMKTGNIVIQMFDEGAIEDIENSYISPKNPMSEVLELVNGHNIGTTVVSVDRYTVVYRGSANNSGVNGEGSDGLYTLIILMDNGSGSVATFKSELEKIRLGTWSTPADYFGI